MGGPRERIVALASDLAAAVAARCARLAARLRGRDDSEHEQALIRLAMIVGMYAYLLVMAPAAAPGATLVFVAGLAGSLAIVAHILARPAVNRPRRCAALVLDACGITGAMLVGGTPASIFFPLLLWIILGHGFRYGRAYLLAATVISIVLLSGVLTLSSSWAEQPFIAVAALMALVILPAYFALLLGKLQDALRRAEAGSRTKSRFLATVSHEFRTPLNAVIGMGELLGATRLDREQRDMVATIGGAAGSLLRLVDRVLELARLEARGPLPQPETVDLHEIIAGVRHLLTPAAAAKGLGLHLRLEPGLPWSVRLEADPLRQVLVNLVGNAIKYTDEGGVWIEAGTRLVNGSRRLLLAVRDTGRGMSAGAQERVFEPFVQIKESRRPGDGGLGLGLSIARELTLLMGGTLGVESERGRGTAFHADLPLVPAETQDAALPADALVVVLGGAEAALRAGTVLRPLVPQLRLASVPAAAVSLVRGHDGPGVVLVAGGGDDTDVVGEAAAGLALHFANEPVDVVSWGAPDPQGRALALLPAGAGTAEVVGALRAGLSRPAAALSGQHMLLEPAAEPLDILVAEDNRTNQRVIQRILERAGHRPTIVDDGTDVLDLLPERHFDVLVLDINMPRTTGVETMRLLSFALAADEIPPAIALSADSTPEMREACAAVGFAAYLTKPIVVPELLSTLTRVVGERGRPPRPETRPAPGERAPQPDLVVVDSASPLNHAKLRALAELDTGDGFLAAVLGEFLEDAAAMLDGLAAAARDGDLATFRSLAHALRSSAAHVGGQALMDVCSGWRGLDQARLRQEGPGAVNRARRELERLRQAFAAATPLLVEASASSGSSR